MMEFRNMYNLEDDGFSESQLQDLFSIVFKELEINYPTYKVDACDVYGIYVINDNNDPVLTFEPGLSGSGQPAYRKVATNEVTLCRKENTEFFTFLN